MPAEPDLLAIKERAAARLMAIPSVTAVGIGGRVRAGQPTGELVLKVYVRAKRPASEVDPAELVPAEFEGIPTDVSELAENGELTAAPTGKALVPQSQMDSRRQRPLIGGAQMQVYLPGIGYGTLGCILVNTSDQTKFYALTNWHVLGGELANPPQVGVTTAGQPTASESVTKCCSSIIGKVAGGSYDGVRDAGAVLLDPGMQWTADILEIGPVTGRYTLTSADAATQTYPVRKRGSRSALTGGTVESINTTWTVDGVTFNDLTIITPNPDPSQPPGTMIYFQQPGDSGAALVNDASQVVGLMFAKTDIPASNISKGGAIPIDTVISTFGTQNQLPVEVAVAAQPGVVNTVPGAAAVAVPPEVARTLAGAAGPARHRDQVLMPIVSGAVAPPQAAALARLERDLDRSARGRELLNLWLDHQAELLRLVSENKRVTVAWHRGGAAALFQLLVRMLTQPDLRLPMTMNDQPLADCLDRVSEAIERPATPALRQSLARIRAALPDLAGRTYAEIMTALAASR
jgi:hypothetical protein